MANLSGSIIVVTRNDLTVQRTITGVPAGDTLASAWLTVKLNKTDADPGIFQRAITSALTAAGQITDTGAGDTQGAVEFYLLPANTSLLTEGVGYHYDIQVRTTAGKTYTVEVGRVTVTGSVTAA